MYSVLDRQLALGYIYTVLESNVLCVNVMLNWHVRLYLYSVNVAYVYKYSVDKESCQYTRMR